MIHRSMTMSVEICVFRMGRSHSTKTGNNLALGSCSAKRLLVTKCESSVICSLVKQQTSHRTGFLPHLLRESRHTPCVCSWIYSSESVVVFARRKCVMLTSVAKAADWVAPKNQIDLATSNCVRPYGHLCQIFEARRYSLGS